MAGRKRRRSSPIGMATYEPDPKQMRHMAAEEMADRTMKADPQMRKRRNHILDEIERAADRAVRKAPQKR